MLLFYSSASLTCTFVTTVYEGQTHSSILLFILNVKLNVLKTSLEKSYLSAPDDLRHPIDGNSGCHPRNLVSFKSFPRLTASGQHIAKIFNTLYRQYIIVLNELKNLYFTLFRKIDENIFTKCFWSE